MLMIPLFIDGSSPSLLLAPFVTVVAAAHVYPNHILNHAVHRGIPVFMVLSTILGVMRDDTGVAARLRRRIVLLARVAGQSRRTVSLTVVLEAGKPGASIGLGL